MVKLQNDIFIIPIEEDKNIIYAPLRKAAFYANNNAAKFVDNYIKNNITLDKGSENNLVANLIKLEQLEVSEPVSNNKVYTKDKATIILSQKCNLACTYCYAQESRSKETLSKEYLRVVIDYVLSNETKRKKHFSFIGGGEPTVTWELFQWAVEYIREIATKKKVSVNIGLTTNTTLLNNSKISWLKNNNVKVGISYDILPTIQDTQRPFYNKQKSSFEVVDKNLKHLLQMGFSCRIRSTITMQNVNLMPKMVEFVSENYPLIRHLHFEPVTDIAIDNNDFYISYIENYFIAQNVAEKRGIKIRNSITTAFERLDKRFCRGEFCITPTGKIVSCHRVSSEKDSFFDNFLYGAVTNKIEINDNLEHDVLSKNNENLIDCSTCFAKWHCAGGCPSNRFLFSEKQKEDNCNFTREMIKKLLEIKLINT